MAIEPIDLTAWTDRIQAEAPDALRFIGRAGDLQAAQASGSTVCPAGYFLPPSYRQRDNGAGHASSQGISQEIDATVVLIYSARHYQDARQSKALEQVEAIQAALWPVLVGWTPYDDGAAVRYVSGRLLGLDRRSGIVWYSDTYILRRLFRRF